MISGAQAVVDCLRREKVRHIFGIPGTQNPPVLDVLRETPDIRFILTRHEQGAAFMAYGYARALNRPGVVTATEAVRASRTSRPASPPRTRATCR